MKLSKLLKLPIEYYIIFLLFVVVIFMSIYGGSLDVKPYGNANSLHMYNYEGFHANNSMTDSSVANTAANANANGAENLALNSSTTPMQRFELDGLKAAPLDMEPMYNPVSKLNGSHSCFGSSMGLSNDKGALCIDDELKKQFSTRGGNQSGRDMQIGA